MSRCQQGVTCCCDSIIGVACSDFSRAQNRDAFSRHKTLVEEGKCDPEACKGDLPKFGSVVLAGARLKESAQEERERQRERALDLASTHMHVLQSRVEVCFSTVAA